MNPNKPAAPRVALTATAGAALLLCAMAAQAQVQPQEPQQITVTGIRGAIETAISIKKNADTVVEVISAEDIGKLPDTSIAESIARLPGVAAQRTAGRASQVSVRGFAPDFSTTLLNGREQVTTGDSRGVEYDQYPSELVSSVIVHKSPSAGLVGQGLSATIDVQTVRPLDAGKRGFAANYRRQKSGIGLDQEGEGYRASFSYIDQFADRTIGVALGFARLDETGPRTSKFEAWGVADSCPVAPVAGACPGGTVRAPGGFNDILEQETKTRDGAFAVLEYRPNKNFRSTVDVFKSKFERAFFKNYFQAPVGFSSAGGYDPEGQLTATQISGGVATAGSFNNFKGVVRVDAEKTTDDIDAIGWKNEFKLGEMDATIDLSRSKAKRRGGIVESTAGLPGNATALDTISWTGFDGNNVGGARYTTGLNYTDLNVVRLTDVMGWGGGAALPQAGYSKLPQVDDELRAVRGSLKGGMDWGWAQGWEVGANLTDREKDRAYIEGRLVIGNGSDPFATAPIPSAGNLVTGRVGIPIANWDPSGLVGSTYTVAQKLVRDIANKDWNVQEKVTTLYGKVDLENKLFGFPVRGNAGVQLQHTDQKSTAFSVDGGPCPGDVCRTIGVTDGKTYSDFMPSLNLNADIGAGQTVRLGLARVIARPNINDMRASLGFGVDTTLGVLKGDAGNPQLEPFRANQIDLSYEKYFGGTKGYIAAAAFYKDLSTFIFKQDVVTDFTPFVTTTTPLPPGGQVLGLLNRPVNGKGGGVRGLELAASLPLSMLTPMADGFGIEAKYALTSSAINVPSAGITGDAIQTPNIPLPGLSKRVWGLTAYFEKWGFSARVATRYRSDFIGEVTDIVGDRRLTYVKAERITDLQLGYEFQSGFAKGLSVVFQANNIGDEPYIRYRDNPSNEIENTKYGKTYLFGLNYKL